MTAPQRIFLLVLIASLLTGCGANASLWGSLPTPTPNAKTPIPTAVKYPLLPSITPSPSLTPLAVLPLSETTTPGGIADAPIPTLPPINTTGPMILYNAQSGDTLAAVSQRFGVRSEEIISDVVLPQGGEFIQPGTLMLIPKFPQAGGYPFFLCYYIILVYETHHPTRRHPGLPRFPKLAGAFAAPRTVRRNHLF